MLNNEITNTQIYEVVSNNLNISKTNIQPIFNNIFETIIKMVKNDNTVIIRGFGSFKLEVQEPKLKTRHDRRYPVKNMIFIPSKKSYFILNNINNSATNVTSL